VLCFQTSQRPFQIQNTAYAATATKNKMTVKNAKNSKELGTSFILISSSLLFTLLLI